MYMYIYACASVSMRELACLMDRTTVARDSKDSDEVGTGWLERAAQQDVLGLVGR